MKRSLNIGILGAGSWGSTLAALLIGNAHRVTLWSWSAEDAEAIRSTGRNEAYLPGIDLPRELHVTTDAEEAVSGRDIVVIATPSQYLRSVLGTVPAAALRDGLIVNVAKGIEQHSLLRMSQVVADCIPDFDAARYVVLSGPSHAEEVIRRKATTVVAASTDERSTARVISTFMNDYFRVYASTDVIGVELGGSLKNVIAIGAGICDGAEFGDNTKAALITRGIAEIRRLGEQLDADPHTFAGLSGLGDLIVTTMSRHSRNRYVGEQIGRGTPPAEVIAGMRMVAEGVPTTQSARDLARARQVEMPIVEQMYAILFDGKDPILATQELMTRQAKQEVWS
ncbi:MAG TPA: NAD(P)H-dependent glycerol-3-phosphate dehydrogenase [Bacteroidota bacterium]|nr:NAD(P)H-dependent glycerol-3-phosphate dehydrogenase [Bacteroidota bacterium]